jgi:hypothetical protein
MIKANELRIGNWILPEHDLDGKYHIVGVLRENSVNETIESWYSPIPLTPEILEACGFKDCKMEIGAQILSVSIKDGDASIYDAHIHSSNTDFPCKYLHQLQNIHYSLTSEELEVNIHLSTLPE